MADLNAELARYENLADRVEAGLAASTKPTTMKMDIGTIFGQQRMQGSETIAIPRTNLMSRATMEDCLHVFRQQGFFETLEICGAAPETNPNLEWLLESASKLGNVTVRPNLIALDDPGFSHLIGLYAAYKVNLVATVPMRVIDDDSGERTRELWEPCIRTLRKLNAVGYGTNPEQQITLEYLTIGPYDAESLGDLRSRIEKQLDVYGITCNELDLKACAPLGPFGEKLMGLGKLDQYMCKLIAAYDEATLTGLPCRNQLAIGHDGRVYDCRFNQYADMPVENWDFIGELVHHDIEPRPICTGSHCFACTAISMR